MKNMYKMNFTPDISITFEKTGNDSVEIDFVHHKQLLSAFEVYDTDFDWFDEKSVSDFIAKDIVIETLSNLILYYKDGYEDLMGDVCFTVARAAKAFESLLQNPSEFAQYIIDILDISPLTESRKNKHKNIRENEDFVPTNIHFFLFDVEENSKKFDKDDIRAFERDVFSPNDKNVKALKRLYKKYKYIDENGGTEYEINQIYQNVADIVIGVVDYEQN